MESWFLLMTPKQSANPCIERARTRQGKKVRMSKSKFKAMMMKSFLTFEALFPFTGSLRVRRDLDHVFFGCEKYKDASSKLVENVLNCNIAAPFNLLHLLTTDSRKVYSCIMNFITETEIKL
ncbi:hypothetical protein NQ318_001122 [Aromia moschata]|uniref:Uncharacterized protein n=1 Tax=Aromia moschata TaxID=1265417 RepID=A0AAV8ZEN7_9CUCU|nr:hypothetical protein NQ318_001122 [Aromia moschata]